MPLRIGGKLAKTTKSDRAQLLADYYYYHYSDEDLVYQAYKNRVEADGGTLYNTRECTINAINALEAIELKEWSTVEDYYARVAADGGTTYNGFLCTREAIIELNN